MARLYQRQPLPQDFFTSQSKKWRFQSIGAGFSVCAVYSDRSASPDRGVRVRTTRLGFLYTANVTWMEVFELLVLGLATGVVGGLLGIGGSIIIIPFLILILNLNQHLAQAIAMIINVFVALPALLQHHRAKAVRWDVMLRMLPLGIVFILVGVESSNRVDAALLKRIFGAFLIYIIIINVRQLLSRRPEPEKHQQRVGWIPIGSIGAVTGFIAGLLGIGGGNISVPLLQRIGNLPLRQCIATSAGFMCVSASFGATRKVFSLASLDQDPYRCLMLAAILAPTAIIGGLIGGRLTHILPLTWVRLAFILLLSWACADMLGLW